MKQWLFLLIAMLALMQPVRAQSGLSAKPLSMRKAMSNIQQISQLPARSQLSEAIAAANADDFAVPLATDFNPCNSGEWHSVDNQRVWRLAIASHNALSLNLIFTDFNIPCGAALYIYSADSARPALHYTSDDNAPVLPTPLISGDVVVVEYNEPDSADFQGFFNIVQVAHGFRNVLMKQDAENKHDCYVNADDESVAEWSDTRRSICKILIGGTTFCTGVLLNTANGSFLPYVLTARHCINTDKQAQNSIFYFNYESSDSLDNHIVGAEIVAMKDNDDGYLDFALLKLNSSIPDDFNVYYAGWDYSDIQPVGAVCIHHPNGDVKKISVDTDTLRSASYRLFDTDSFWNVEEWESGATEVGSSGAPLFNAAHRVVGILSGGDSDCDYPMNDYFQKFSVCYSRYQGENLQLAHWLNPAGANISAIDGSYMVKSGLPLKKQSDNCSVYPNPVHSQLFLSTENEIVAEVEISDLAGSICLQMRKIGQMTVDVSVLPQGVYICHIGFVSGNDYKCLIIKE
ncbi:MAG: trypsin-like peptidase domain-containing protein [Salinivirgaceae bacterium]|nr:trypsin-like peptidase domain-containing protein [Salinivirgaceae bacterium]